MSEVKRFATARDKDGNVVMEFFGPGQSHDGLSDALRMLTFHLQQRTPEESHSAGFFGGSFGYGVTFENDVFLMHPFCWCEQDDCLWCGASSCRVEIPRRPHTETCYQTRLERLKRQYGTQTSWGWSVPFGCKPYDKKKRELCQELGCDYEFRNEVHCTCGSDAEWKRRYDACDCDWHAGRGRYRFGASTAAPNFWHKPSGLKVRWYKYIGRCNKVDVPADVTLADVFGSCLASIGLPRLDEAFAAYAQGEKDAAEEAQQSMEWVCSEEGRKFYDEMFGAGDDGCD